MTTCIPPLPPSHPTSRTGSGTPPAAPEKPSVATPPAAETRPGPQATGSTQARLMFRGRRESVSGRAQAPSETAVQAPQPKELDRQAAYARSQSLQALGQMACDSVSRWQQAATSNSEQLAKELDVPQTVR